MTRLFYDHLIDLDEVHARLDALSIESHDRGELLELIDQTIHYEVLNIILHHLPLKHHDTFLRKFTEDPHDTGIWIYLRKTAHRDIEDYVRSTIIRVYTALDV